MSFRASRIGRRTLLKRGTVAGAGVLAGMMDGPLAAAPPAAPARRWGQPDLVLYNARGYSVDAKDSVVQAVAIAGDRIVATGSSAEMLRIAGPGAKKVNLEGRALVPGFFDGHPHMDGVGMRRVLHSLGRVRSVKDIVRAVGEEVAKRKPGEWVVFQPVVEGPELYGYPDALEEHRWPTRQDLDQVSPNNPVYIEAPGMASPGTAIANTAALRTSRLTKDFQPPDGMDILRDSSGEPTGVILDYRFPKRLPAAGGEGRPAVYPQIPLVTNQQIDDSILAGMKAFNAAGLTGIYEGHGLGSRVQAAYARLHARGVMTVRANIVFAFPPEGYTRKEVADAAVEGAIRAAGYNGFGDDYLKFTGFGFSFDSSAASGSCLMREPYTNTQGQTWKGLQMVPDEGFRNAVWSCARAGLRVQVQCSGGAAIDKVLALYEEVNREIPIAGKRWTIEHCQFPSADNIQTCRRLGVIPSTAATFLAEYGVIYLKSFGAALANQAIPFKSWLDGGVDVAASTDGRPFEPMFNFWNMLARRDTWTKTVIGPDQRLTRPQALRTYTMNSARMAFREDRVGSIEPGKFADLVVLSDDIMTIPEDRIPDAKALATLVGGRAVHDTGLMV